MLGGPLSNKRRTVKLNRSNKRLKPVSIAAANRRATSARSGVAGAGAGLESECRSPVGSSPLRFLSPLPAWFAPALAVFLKYFFINQNF